MLTTVVRASRGHCPGIACWMCHTASHHLLLHRSARRPARVVLRVGLGLSEDLTRVARFPVSLRHPTWRVRPDTPLANWRNRQRVRAYGKSSAERLCRPTVS